jgi:long-chain acyl-CoA synthetase
MSAIENPPSERQSWRDPPPHSYRPLGVAWAIRSSMARNPGKVALRFEGRSITYADLMRRIDLVTAASVAGLGLRVGDRVAISARNSIEFIEIIVGLTQAGVAVVTINPRLTPAEIEMICADSEPRYIFADAPTARVLADLNLPPVARIFAIGADTESWMAQAKPLAELPLVDEWATFTIPYTSGTTGKPKGVMVSARSRILNFLGMAAEYQCYSSDDRFLGVAPLCFGAGLAFTLASLYFGGEVDLMDRYEPEIALRILKERAITGMFVVPTHFHELFQLSDAALAGWNDLPSLRAIVSNAAPLPFPLKARAVEYFGPGILHEAYGSTEGAVVTSLRPADQLRKPHTVGHPFIGNLVRIVNADGEDCAVGEVGELLSNSPYLFNGYLNKPKETAEVFRPGGWLGVGDLATRDDEGFISIVGRNKDMVISGGVNIYPREVEEALMLHPGVIDAAVIGVPDPKWGEKLRAFVVKRGGADVTEDALLEFTGKKLSAFKVPKETIFIDAMPRNTNGKILKTALRDWKI